VTDTELTIDLNKKVRALRSDNRWLVQRRRTDGEWETATYWNGGRRSLILWCEANDVHPSREAEAALDLISETSGFKERA
jgi:hypothetical protein